MISVAVGLDFDGVVVDSYEVFFEALLKTFVTRDKILTTLHLVTSSKQGCGCSYRRGVMGLASGCLPVRR